MLPDIHCTDSSGGGMGHADGYGFGNGYGYGGVEYENEGYDYGADVMENLDTFFDYSSD